MYIYIYIYTPCKHFYFIINNIYFKYNLVQVYLGFLAVTSSEKEFQEKTILGQLHACCPDFPENNICKAKSYQYC